MWTAALVFLWLWMLYSRLLYLETRKELFQGVVWECLIITLPLSVSYTHLMTTPFFSQKNTAPACEPLFNYMRQYSPRHSAPSEATWQMSGAITCGYWTGQPSQLSTSYSGNNGWIALYNGQHWEEREKSSGDRLSPFSYHTCTHIHIQLLCRPS